MFDPLAEKIVNKFEERTYAYEFCDQDLTDLKLAISDALAAERRLVLEKEEHRRLNEKAETIIELLKKILARLESIDEGI